jgi:DNA-damage-inducible protein D
MLSTRADVNYTNFNAFALKFDKAKETCKNTSVGIYNHFADVSKMVVIGSGAEKEIDDILLSRYACYLIAQNGDSRKLEIAFAQTYFAVQTRRAEIIEQRILDYERVEARNKLAETEHVDNNLAVRNMLGERGIVPENLPAAEDVKKIARKLKSDEKKAFKC